MFFNTAIILAGGKSSRMGFDKQFIKVNDRFVIDIMLEKLQLLFNEIIIVTNKPMEYEKKYHNIKIVSDEIKDLGPLSGIHIGLKTSNSMFNYLTACDMPRINMEYINYMKSLIVEKCYDTEAVVTRFGDWIEPFNAFYSKQLVEKIESNAALNKRKIGELLENSKVSYIEEEAARIFSPTWEMFMNLNTVEDLRKLERN